MSFSISSMPLLFGSSSDTTTNLLGILYGNGNSSTAPAGGNPITALHRAETNGAKSIATTAKEPAISRDIAVFRAAVASSKDLKTLLANPVARKVFLTANGLGDQVDATALAQKALASDPAVKTSLASQLTDTRWLAVAKTFNFASKGLAALQGPKVLDTISNGYAEVSWRKSLDVTTPGLSSALDFRTRASTITSALQVLGDPVLRDVITTGLGLPKEIAIQSLDAQEKAITSRVDLTKFKDPKFTEQFLTRYLVAAGAAANAGGASASDITALFA